MKKFILCTLSFVTLSFIMASCGGDEPEQPKVQNVKYPEGAVHGLFSVGTNKQVMFSNGNLQYHADKAAAHNDHFRFAESQYTIIGKDGNEGIGSVPCTIDLFGWGTGNNPRETSTDNADYADFHEWGDNPIKNGGNTAKQWRTLKREEWQYLMHRNQDTLFGIGSVNGIQGVILLPDNWKMPEQITTPFYPSILHGLEWTGVAFESPTGKLDADNKYTATEWVWMEANGAVFLPVSGRRDGTSVSADGGYYWSETPYSADAELFAFFEGGIYPSMSLNRYYGQSVRLVHDLTEEDIIKEPETPQNPQDPTDSNIPTGLTAHCVLDPGEPSSSFEPGTNHVDLSWNKVAGAKEYKVYREDICADQQPWRGLVIGKVMVANRVMATVTEPSYTDSWNPYEHPQAGAWPEHMDVKYTVTAITSKGESKPSEAVTIDWEHAQYYGAPRR